MMLGSGKEIVHFMRATRSLASAWYVAKRLSRHFLDVLKHGRGMTLTNGNALAGRLAASAFKLGIPLWLNAPAKSLIIEDGAVKGAVVQRDGASVRVRAARAVVLAAGGFPYDIERRKQLYAHAPTGVEHYSPSPSGNTGDGLRLAESAGGSVNTSLPNAAAWVPVSVVTRKDGSPGYMPHFIDRAKPGVIAVTRNGRRFTNEGASYHDFVQDMVRACQDGGEICAWLVCDHKTLRKYGLGSAAPFPMPIKRYLRTGYLLRGSSVAELAQRAGIDAGSLRQTVEAFNAEARLGRDPLHGKGSKAYNRYQGDALHGPNPVAPIEQGPYYAIKVMIGDIGTFAGLKVDAEGRVTDAGGAAIDGLYAVGNDACSIMGGNYPGAGITLGPALTFGYIAGRSIAGQLANRKTARAARSPGMSRAARRATRAPASAERDGEAHGQGRTAARQAGAGDRRRTGQRPRPGAGAGRRRRARDGGGPARGQRARHRRRHHRRGRTGLEPGAGRDRRPPARPPPPTCSGMPDRSTCWSTTPAS